MMKYICSTGLFLFVFFHYGSATQDHDIHISLSEVRWNPETTTFEVSVKIFIDDLELALAKQNVLHLQIGTPKESAEAENEIEKYLRQHFTITLDGKKLEPHLLGKEVTDDFQAIWCYVEFAGPAMPKTCTIDNSILFEMYDDQRNIMDIKMSSKDKSYTFFDPKHHTWSYTF